MKDDRPYIVKPSENPPPPDSESTSAGVHSARWVRRRQPDSPHLDTLKSALKSLLPGKDWL
jgi:hypothetical protein